MKQAVTILFLLAVFFIPVKSHGQTNAAADSFWREQQIIYAAAIERKEFSGANALIYQGYEYVPFLLPVSGTPFYLSKEWQKGDVVFKGRQYKDLPLLYDIFKDILILKSPDKMYRIALDGEKVQQFTLDHRRFIHIGKETEKGLAKLTPGYYELLFAGGDSLFARRTKIVHVPTEPGMSRFFREKDSYYIKKGGSYYPVGNRRSLLKILHDHKSAIKKFIRKQDIHFRKEKETALITILRYYDRISE